MFFFTFFTFCAATELTLNFHWKSDNIKTIAIEIKLSNRCVTSAINLFTYVTQFFEY